MAFQQTYPTIDDFRAAVAAVGQTIPGTPMEVIKWSLYDTLLYPLAGTNLLQFFQNPQGQGLTVEDGAVGAKTLGDTNMQAAGTLPSPQMFYIDTVEVDFQPGSSAAANTWAPVNPFATGIAAGSDVYQFIATGNLQLNIMEKKYLKEAPLMRFPPKCRAESDIGGVATGAVLRAGGRPYMLNPGIVLLPQQNFNIVLTWPALVATIANNGKVRTILDGWLARAIQ